MPSMKSLQLRISCLLSSLWRTSLKAWREISPWWRESLWLLENQRNPLKGNQSTQQSHLSEDRAPLRSGKDQLWATPAPVFSSKTPTTKKTEVFMWKPRKSNKQTPRTLSLTAMEIWTRNLRGCILRSTLLIYAMRKWRTLLRTWGRKTSGTTPSFLSCRTSREGSRMRWEEIVRPSKRASKVFSLRWWTSSIRNNPNPSASQKPLKRRKAERDQAEAAETATAPQPQLTPAWTKTQSTTRTSSTTRSLNSKTPSLASSPRTSSTDSKAKLATNWRNFRRSTTS